MYGTQMSEWSLITKEDTNDHILNSDSQDLNRRRVEVSDYPDTGPT